MPFVVKSIFIWRYSRPYLCISNKPCYFSSPHCLMFPRTYMCLQCYIHPFHPSLHLRYIHPSKIPPSTWHGVFSLHIALPQCSALTQCAFSLSPVWGQHYAKIVFSPSGGQGQHGALSKGRQVLSVFLLPSFILPIFGFPDTREIFLDFWIIMMIISFTSNDYRLQNLSLL